MINSELRQIHDDAKALFARLVSLNKKLRDEREAHEKAKRDGDPYTAFRYGLHLSSWDDEEIASRAAHQIWSSVDTIALHIARDEAVNGGAK